MKRTFAFIVTLAFLNLLITPAVFAQVEVGQQSNYGRGMGRQYDRLYDPSTVETIAGEVMTIETQTSRRGMASSISLTVETATGNALVHLGPAWYLNSQDAQIEPGDKIEVTGSNVILAGEPTIIAAEVHKGDQTLVLRDQNGVPAWSGWRRP
jgi:hypothetical protein